MTRRTPLPRAGLIGALALAAALGTGAAAQARPQTCYMRDARGHEVIVACRPGYGPPPHVTVIHGPRVGDHIRGGTVVEWHRYRRLPPPPRHQEYRVIDNQIVRVDQRTLQVAAVIGLASVLLAAH